MPNPTPLMLAHMRINRWYLRMCLGWSPQQLKELAHDYNDVMQSVEGFETVKKHLESVADFASKQLQTLERKYK